MKLLKDTFLPQDFDPYLRNTHKYDANDHRDTTLRRPPLGGPNALLASISVYDIPVHDISVYDISV